MKTLEFASEWAYFFIFVVISGICLFCMLEPLNQKLDAMKKMQQESPSIDGDAATGFSFGTPKINWPKYPQALPPSFASPKWTDFPKRTQLDWPE